jgi:D-alanyl-D-alanine carboxypeptidase/D-alanyl-D-alanine-endopeptidase (penicillin-binding protein 4)
VLAAAAAAVALGGCGGGSGLPGGARDAGGAHRGPRARPADPPTTLTAPLSGQPLIPQAADSRSARRTPALRHLQFVLGRTLHDAGPQTGALVFDVTSGAALFSAHAGIARRPASVEKLYTTLALLHLLGPQARLHTRILGVGHLAGRGTWQGDLYLRGDGDPTFGDGWYDHVYEADQGTRVADLVAQLRRLGVRRVTGRIYGDGSRFDNTAGGPATAGAPDTPDYGGVMGALVFDHGATGKGYAGPAAFAAHELALTMRAQHVFAQAGARPRAAPPGARALATVASAPLPVLLKLMDVPSDDLFADLLTKLLGLHFLGRGTLAAGAAEIRAAITAVYGLHPRILDGSGLDRADRTTPDQIVSLLRQAWRTRDQQALEAALPVVGVGGTVAGIGRRTPAQGHCVAKTGTLDYVTNLAGVCQARDGHQLAFALFLDGPANWQGYVMLSEMVGAIAGY